MNENENTTDQYLCDTTKAAVRGKFIALNVFIIKEGKFSTNDLTFHLKNLEKEQNKSSASRWKDLINIRAKINEIENKKTVNIR